MRRIVALILLLLPWLTCAGQNLFFGKLAATRWAIRNFSGVAALQQATDIQLYDTRPDSALGAATCMFGDRLLIRQYDPQTGQTTILAAYAYQADPKHGTVTIFFNDKNAVAYQVGITSTGKFALLSRRRKQTKAAS